MKTRGKSKPAVEQPKTQEKFQYRKNTESQSQPKVQTNNDEKNQKMESQDQQRQQIKHSKAEQEKKVPKPKKYLKKNYDQLSRIDRSKYQKIYLLEAERQQDQSWRFLVQGASGSNYGVHIHHSGLKCGCIDFRMKKKPCKHIYFIVTQVAQNPQILDYFNNSTKISKTAYKILDDQLAKRLKLRMEKKQQSKEKPNIDLKDDTDCTICFTEMNKDTEALEGCQTCKKYFHFECLLAWKKHSGTCPLCRSKFSPGPEDPNDPLGKLKAVQINASQD